MTRTTTARGPRFFTADCLFWTPSNPLGGPHPADFDPAVPSHDGRRLYLWVSRTPLPAVPPLFPGHVVAADDERAARAVTEEVAGRCHPDHADPDAISALVLSILTAVRNAAGGTTRNRSAVTLAAWLRGGATDADAERAARRFVARRMTAETGTPEVVAAVVGSVLHSVRVAGRAVERGNGAKRRRREAAK